MIEQSAPVAEPRKQEPLEYWNAVEGWVKIDEVREHFDSVGCGTIYKSAGEGRVPLTTAQRQARSADTWVGLTEKEKRDARNSVSYSPLAMTMGEWTEAVQDATEAKLREKNA